MPLYFTELALFNKKLQEAQSQANELSEYVNANLGKFEAATIHESVDIGEVDALGKKLSEENGRIRKIRRSKKNAWTTQATQHSKELQLVKNVAIEWKYVALGQCLGRLNCKDIEDLDQKIVAQKIVAQTADSDAKERSLLSLHQIIAGIVFDCAKLKVSSI